MQIDKEKATLKERLWSITKYRKNSKTIMLMPIVLLVALISGTMVLGGCIDKTGLEVPDTAISTPNLKIDDLLAKIMSSPKESSNPGDYIAAHQEEYDAIIKMDAEALPYLFSEFEKGGQTGLKGHIMERLCRNILGGEDIRYANTDPQDWYDTYKAHMLSMLEKNSLEFIKSNNPKGSIILNNTQEEEIRNTRILYDFGLLYAYKNISLSDSDKVRELVSQLQYAQELPIDRIEFASENEEILRIDYRMNLTVGQEYKVNHTKKMADVVMLFALLDDLNAVEYNLVQADYGYGGVPITREQAEQVLGADINTLGTTETVFLSEMPKIIADLQWNPGVMDIITYEHIMR